jgi:flagellar M-ring protein FliF
MNNGLGQVTTQLFATWRQLGINQRVSIVMALGVVLAGLGALTFWSSRVDYALLYGKLDEGEAARVIAALDEAKIPYRARAGGAVLVPGNKVHATRLQLASKGIPRGDGIGFEIFDKPNFGISDFVQRANYVRAIQGELARTISQVDQVESARVMIVMPENRLLVDNQRKPTASVFVRVRGNSELPAQAVNAIRFLVANSVEGLQARAVSVVDNLGNVLSEHSESDTAAGLTSTQITARKNLEQYLGKKAEGMLEAVLGPGQAIVRVAADINFDTNTRTEERFDPESQVIRVSTINDENTDTTSPLQGGVPAGVVSETGEPGAPAMTSNRMRKKVVNNQYDINRMTTSTMQAPGGIRRLSAAVFVAARMEGTGADRRPAPRTSEELERLRRIVQSALGIVEGDTLRKDEVTLEEMPFNDQPTATLTQQMERQQQHEFWFEIARNALYPLLAVVILFLFWRALKKTGRESIPLGVPLNGFGENGSNGQRKGAEAVLTPELLNQLVREDPANMTQAIRTWMARGKPPTR